MTYTPLPINDLTIYDLYRRVENAGGIFAYYSIGPWFGEILKEALLVGRYPFGYFYVDEVDQPHFLRLHAAIWSKDVFRHIDDMRADFDELLTIFKKERLETVVPTAYKAINRLLERVGFRLEGTLRSYYNVNGNLYDGNIYSKLRGESWAAEK